MPAVLTERVAPAPIRERVPQPQRQPEKPPKMPIVVMRGDGAANDVLDASLKVLDATGLPFGYQEFDLSLPNRTATEFGVVKKAARALRTRAYGLKAATMRPPKALSVDRAIRKEIDADVIVRSAEPIPNTDADGKRGSITIVRMAYSETEGEVFTDPSGQDIAYETRWVPRSSATKVARYAFKLASEQGGVVIGGPERAKDTVDGVLWQEINYAQDAYPDVDYEGMTLPRLFGKLVVPDARHLFIPALGRDGNLLSDPVAQHMGGNPSTLASTTLALDADYEPYVVLADVLDDEPARKDSDPHYNPTGMIFAGARLLGHMPDARARQAAEIISTSVNEVLAEGIKTPDLGGTATTNAFTNEVVDRVRDRMPQT